MENTSKTCGPFPIKRVEKGWGHELWIVNKNYCGKLLFFEKGKMCSWHYHNIKDEVFYIQTGKLKVMYGRDDNLEKSDTIILEKGQNFHVPPGLRHRMIALEDTELFEFSTHHKDEDSIRIQKGD